jgi:hypothetical protein
MLDRAHAGGHGLLDALGRVRVRGHRHAEAIRLVDRGPQLLGENATLRGSSPTIQTRP